MTKMKRHARGLRCGFGKWLSRLFFFVRNGAADDTGWERRAPQGRAEMPAPGRQVEATCTYAEVDEASTGKLGRRLGINKLAHRHCLVPFTVNMILCRACRFSLL
ncbi:hypothetical protein B0T16DRAFT_138020 [Cercophora newfieldiana]|uniref:Uncharacterized protein n=1 Tax=Cercophora newfieldiana TaxID=92897 RepID=A0AA39YC26_9PEZI|nr:hypothetical protein B0T16DRAFT_138020 [Cercophora newfieldiana]